VGGGGALFINARRALYLKTLRSRRKRRIDAHPSNISVGSMVGRYVLRTLATSSLAGTKNGTWRWRAVAANGIAGGRTNARFRANFLQAAAAGLASRAGMGGSSSIGGMCAGGDSAWRVMRHRVGKHGPAGETGKQRGVNMKGEKRHQRRDRRRVSVVAAATVVACRCRAIGGVASVCAAA